MRPEIVPGGVFPDYELPDHTSRLRKLSEQRSGLGSFGNNQKLRTGGKIPCSNFEGSGT